MEAGELEMYVVISGDGSNTIKVPALKEHYHSHKGAINESKHVFIKMGLEGVTVKDELNILEVGFGTGLNALLTALNGIDCKLNYVALEPYPLDTSILNQLNYVDELNATKASDIYQAMHTGAWNTWIDLSANMRLVKRQDRIEEYDGSEKFDLVYYDAFAPHAQPELWEPQIWQILFNQMNFGGVLVTYCAKGQVRRDMQAAGFSVERLPGPPGKREMLRASKPIS